MKRSAILIAMLANLAFSSDPKTQNKRLLDEPTKCEEYKSLYYQYLKNDMNEDARHFWNLAYQHCDESDGKDSIFYNNGIIIYYCLMDDVSIDDFQRRTNLFDSLSWLYDEFYELVEDPVLQLKHAHLLGEHRVYLERQKECWSYIHKSKSFTPGLYLYRYYRYFLQHEVKESSPERKEEKWNEGVKLMVTLADYANEALSNGKLSPKDVDAIEKAKKYIYDKGAYLVRDCNVLVDQMRSVFRDTMKRNDLKYLVEYLNLLDHTNCATTDFYLEIQESLMTIDPSPDMAINIARSSYKNKDYTRALSFYDQAISLTPSDSLIGTITYEKALVYYSQGNYNKAFEQAKRVNGKAKADAYLLCAKSIAANANACGVSSFERKANFWLANDYIVKAINNGASAANDLYMNRTPTKADILENKYQLGDKITHSCWSETTTVR